MLSNNVILHCARRDRDLTFAAGTGHPDYKIAKLEGLTGLEFNFTTSVNPQVPGVEINNKRASPRIISFEIDCKPELRDKSIQFFNPMFTGRLVVTWNGITRWIDYIPRPIKVETPNVFSTITLKVELYCPSPYLNDMNNYGKDITFRQPLLAFPFVMLADRGLVASYRIPSNAVTLNNTGDFETPIRVLFQAFGNVSNPRIILNESKFIQVNVDMAAGDTLDISTNPNDIYVRLNGATVLHKTDKQSQYFQLPVGESILSYQAGEEFDALSVVVYFTPQYQGV